MPYECNSSYRNQNDDRGDSQWKQRNHYNALLSDSYTYHEVTHTRSGYRSGTRSYNHTEHRSHLSGNSRVHTLEEESKATMTHTEGFFSLPVCACM